ncbi:unnamed protein product [Bursaphelenchus xylophilus]|uniref:(pine wood nematode) hypothetical protein n=1 Tax=Bursaphelenchus xylophilus TaxID=6326 RepID=A0A1I7S4U7_BURXY|nr:unnamed protein product [Bursaphelenchus xylophilus]CAG9117388.1 unnamed protein product [Bursaphelenchus xylophilus]
MDLPVLPFKTLDPGAIALHVSCIAYARYTAITTCKSTVTYSEDPLLNISATAAAEMIRQGRLKSATLVEAYLNRIKEVNPMINAVTELFEEEALQMAKEVDEFIENSDEEDVKMMRQEKPLLGIPVSIKHVFDLKGRRNVCGLHHLREASLAQANATAVNRVLKAGAIPICYTNVSPGCMSFETDNVVFGRTPSPHDSRTISGGSSGGEASLICSQGSLIGVGTDLGGSIRLPSILCGIYGLKPRESCSLNGVLPKVDLGDDSHGMYVTGPMVRYAEDLMLLQSVLAPTSIPLPISKPRPARLFISKPEVAPLITLSKTVKVITDDVANYLSKSYSLPIERFDLIKTLQEYFIIFKELLTENFDVAQHLAPNENVNVATEFIKLMSGSSCQSFGLLMSFYAAGRPSPQGTLEESKRQIQILRSRIHQQLEDGAVLVFPGLPETNYYHYSFGALPCFYTSLFNILAVPVLAVPCGKDKNGYPMSVQLVGGIGSENLLCSVAQQMEDRFGGWVKPGV